MLEEACQLAALRWLRATGLYVECGDLVLRLADLPDGVAGETEGNEVWIQPASPEYMYTIIAHELGHVLAGPNRGHSGRGLMAERPEWDADIGEEDLKWLCEESGCLWRDPE